MQYTRRRFDMSTPSIEQSDPPGASNVDFFWGVRIQMRDGVRLAATIYLPKSLQKPVPCVVSLSPYIADTLHEVGLHFATNGYSFAAVDCRGRGNSDGSFHPMLQEAQDGYDVVEWLARQPYCNGKVAMRGGSYLGYVQWATAKELPPHLSTIVPVAAPYPGIDFPSRNNIGYPYVIAWLNLTAGRASQNNIFSDRRFWSQLYCDWHNSGRSFRSLNGLLNHTSPIFEEWLAHPEPDDYWDSYNPTSEQYAKMHLPILTITGSYDDDQPGALEHYQQHLLHAPAAARARHYLIIGPWDHAGTRAPKPEVGGLQMGPASLLDLTKLHLDWYDWILGEHPKPEFLKKHVAYYVMGLEQWHYAESLEEVTARRNDYFLASRFNPSDMFFSGMLLSEPDELSLVSDHYTYDPQDTYGAEAAAELRTDPGSLVDQRVMFALGGKSLF
jgi:uncharacterized protein